MSRIRGSLCIKRCGYAPASARKPCAASIVTTPSADWTDSRDQSEEGPAIVFSIEVSFAIFVLLVVVVCLSASVRILREYERAVVFTLGRLRRSRAQDSSC